jgi:myb proto-oncogene protein
MGFQVEEKPKPKYRKGLWSPEEDNKLRNYILKYGHSCWSSVPIKAGEFFFFPSFLLLINLGFNL